MEENHAEWCEANFFEIQNNWISNAKGAKKVDLNYGRGIWSP